MIFRQIQEKGILAKLLEQCIRILLIKECKNINKLKIDIISNSNQIIKGEIKKIQIIAEDINYKDLLFDKVELESNDLKIKFNLINKAMYFKNNPIVKLKISLSQGPLRRVLLSSKWDWIGNLISKEILNQDTLEDIKIKNNQFLILSSKKHNAIGKEEPINIKAYRGGIYLENKNYNKTIQIPIEDKIYIENAYIENNIISIIVNSSISH